MAETATVCSVEVAWLATEKTKRLGLPVPAVVTFPVVELFSSVDVIDAGEFTPPALNSAATPVTCGVAIEVPLIVLVAVVEVIHAEVIEVPGAKMSRHLP